MRQSQILLMRDAHLIEGEALGKIGNKVHLLVACIARHAANWLQRDIDDDVAGLLVHGRVEL